MKVTKEKIWTWYLPGEPKKIYHDDWIKSGGKWIVFDRKERITALAEALQPYIDAGNIVGAKCWNGDPSAVNVYSLDRDRENTNLILDRLGAGHSRVWEYDYAWQKNIRKPLEFTYSWSLKFWTIVRSHGLPGTIKLMRELFIPGKDARRHHGGE
jgi:hypothetical protein